MNKPSGKISPEENNKVFQMLGDRRQSLSTAVIQLLLANQGSTRQWQLVVTGIACFVKDSVRRGYFIQVRIFGRVFQYNWILYIMGAFEPKF